jgi:NADPH2:quinone reductase
MRAAWFDRQGPAQEVLQVGELPTPEPGPGEVLVRVHASGVNPSDVKFRQGGPGRALPYDPVVPHSDGAGVVDAVGDGVDNARVGERVWIWNGQFRRPFGTAATHVTLPAAQAVPLPDGVDFAAGACLGIPASTAHRCLFADGPIAGQDILITGGAGTVGHYAIQLARWAGARQVIATVSGDAKARHAEAAGATAIVNYRQEDVVERVRELTGGRGVDRIVEVEFGGNLQASQELIVDNGVIAAYASGAEMEPRLPFYPLMFKAVTLRLVLVYLLPEAARRQAIDDLTRALREDALQHTIAARYPLDRVAEAHAAVEAGDKIGTVVVEP